MHRSSSSVAEAPDKHSVDPEVAQMQTLCLDDLIAERSPLIHGVVIGTLCGQDDSGSPLVDFPENPSGRPVSARSTAILDQSDESADRAVVLMFEQGQPWMPVILGLIQKPTLKSPKHATVTTPTGIIAEMDGERMTLTAEKEIVLKCGQASITLTQAGKILIRGAYLLSRSSGVNRIKGGVVHIN